MSRPLTIKEFIKQYQSSSVDRVSPQTIINKNTTNISTNPRPSSKRQFLGVAKEKKKIVVTNIHPHKPQSARSIFNRPSNPHKLSVEGELNFNNSQNNFHNANTSNTSKNAKYEHI